MIKAKSNILPLNTETLKLACDKLSVHVPEQILPSIELYLSLLMQWNKSMNLVGARHWQDCLTKLLIDSFYVANFLKSINLADKPMCWDLGAGAGLPGIVLRMLWDEGHYYLVEAREKRALFLQTVLTRIKLNQTYVFQGRAEEFFTQIKPAHMVISRAFMPWKDVLSLIKDHMDPLGKVIFLSLEPAPIKELDKLGWHLLNEQSYQVEHSTRILWAVQQKA